MDSFRITIVGAGVVGLALAEELSAHHGDVLVVEKNTGFGQETSSRNSEVIHAGIYFPADLLKTLFCIEGNRLLYERCLARAIPHRRLGKLIVAANDEETATLESLKTQAEENGAVVAFQSEVTAIERSADGYDLEINNGQYRFHTRLLVNSAGLHADRIAAQAGMDIDGAGYRLKFCKGNYFCASPSPHLNHLVYPVPAQNKVGLGIHATPDLTGRVRFGPDDRYVGELNYDVDEAEKEAFYLSISHFLPAIDPESLHPDMSGIRPKLQGPGEPPRDFIVQEETKAGFPGLINLIGIESPGLTGSIAIARHCAKLAAEHI